MSKEIEEGMEMFENTKNGIDVTFKMVTDINTKLEDVKNLMVNQAQAIIKTVEQAKTSEALGKIIAVSSKEQKISMEDTLKTITRLSEMASDISLSSHRILDSTSTIFSNATKLNDLIKDID
jgi:methyl-accepting chemotaxis protein